MLAFLRVALQQYATGAQRATAGQTDEHFAEYVDEQILSCSTAAAEKVSIDGSVDQGSEAL